ncbi:MAG: S41 family peptidase [Nitrospiria bacterium]
MKFVKKMGLTPLLLAIGLFGVTLFISKGLETKVSAKTDDYKELKVFTEVLSSLNRTYVEPVDTKELIYGAIKGMLNTLDAHSSFMPPEIYKEMQVETRGQFGGLGLQVGVKDKKLVVVAPIADTPAEKAGLMAGDVILKVDQHLLTEETTLMDAVQKMRGPKGTAVTLTIFRETESEERIFTLVRDTIRIKSVKAELIEPGIGYIQLTQFQEHSARDLRKGIQKLLESDIHSLILDLRNNPGGLLNAAVDVSEQFLESDQLIVSIKSRSGQEDEHRTKRSSQLGRIPVIVLVNEGSASASEIVAGALQDWKRAVILGTETFGKGSVQTILPLSDGSALRLTTAKYYTPKGRSIQNKGISPDIIVKQVVVNEVNDAPIVREKDLPRHLINELADPAEGKKTTPKSNKKNETKSLSAGKVEDTQLRKAIDLMKGWRIFKETAPMLSARK